MALFSVISRDQRQETGKAQDADEQAARPGSQTESSTTRRTGISREPKDFRTAEASTAT